MDSGLPSNLPSWLSLPVLVWAVMMAVYHAAGLLFEWADLTKVLAPFKVRHADKLSYAALLPRVLFNQTCVLLPAMIVPSPKYGRICAVFGACVLFLAHNPAAMAWIISPSSTGYRRSGV